MYLTECYSLQSTKIKESVNYYSPQSNLSGHKNIITYVDSSITHTGNGVYEVLMLMHYCKQNILAMMNAR